MKFWNTNDIGLVGSALTLRTSTTSTVKGKRTTTATSTAPRGGTNLRHITLSGTNTIIVPVGGPSC
jgi:hypothetical protein